MTNEEREDCIDMLRQVVRDVDEANVRALHNGRGLLTIPALKPICKLLIDDHEKRERTSGETGTCASNRNS